MAEFIPLFPLGLVVFPDELLNLHIFEPRYKQLINECKENGKTFGITYVKDNVVQEFGTEIQIISTEKVYPKGEMDIKTKGVSIFKIEKFIKLTPGKLYPGAYISKVEQINETTDLIVSMDLMEKVHQLYDALKIKRKIPDNHNELLTFNIAHHVGLTVDQEYELLKIPDEQTRKKVLLEHIETILPAVRQMESLRRKAQLNGHFKNIDPSKFM